MINLLPLSEKENILLGKKKNLITILWLLFLFFIFCIIFILFLLKTYLQIQLDIQKSALLMNEKRFEQPEIQQFQGKINFINSTLIKLDKFYQKKTYITQVLEKISQLLPKSLTLLNISLRGEGGGIKVAISGIAPARDDLFELRKNLMGEKNFQEVYFPLADWVKATNIDFSVSFKVLK